MALTALSCSIFSCSIQRAENPVRWFFTPDPRLDTTHSISSHHKLHEMSPKLDFVERHGTLTCGEAWLNRALTVGRTPLSALDCHCGRHSVFSPKNTCDGPLTSARIITSKCNTSDTDTRDKHMVDPASATGALTFKS